MAAWQGWRRAVMAAAFAVLAGPALACSCSVSASPDMLALGAPVAFRGRVIAVEALDRGSEPRQRATVEITSLWKGELPARVDVLAGGPGSLCGVRLSPGDERSFFPGEARGGGLQVSQCGMWAARQAEPALSRLGDELAAADAAIAAAPGATAPQLRRAGVLRRWRDHERALAAYRIVAAEAPDLAAAQLGIAHVLIAQGRTAEALAVLEQARFGQQPGVPGLVALARAAMGDFRDLAWADFREADLSNVDLSGQALRGADFSGAYLSRVRFERSDLRGARFEGTRFALAYMQHADLRGARFIAPLGFPDTSGANLREARLERIHVPEGWEFRDVDMRGATLLESRLRGVRFIGSNLERARLTTVHVAEVGFIRTRLEGAVLRDVTFSLVSLSEGSGTAARMLAGPQDLPGVRLINVRFE